MHEAQKPHLCTSDEIGVTALPGYLLALVTEATYLLEFSSHTQRALLEFIVKGLSKSRI